MKIGTCFSRMEIFTMRSQTENWHPLPRLGFQFPRSTGSFVVVAGPPFAL